MSNGALETWHWTLPGRYNISLRPISTILGFAGFGKKITADFNADRGWLSPEERAKTSINANWNELSMLWSWAFRCYYFYASIRVYSRSCNKKIVKSCSSELQGNWKFFCPWCLYMFNCQEDGGKNGVFVKIGLVML